MLKWRIKLRLKHKFCDSLISYKIIILKSEFHAVEYKLQQYISFGKKVVGLKINVLMHKKTSGHFNEGAPYLLGFLFSPLSATLKPILSVFVFPEW